MSDNDALLELDMGDGSTAVFRLLERTAISGHDYLLLTEADEASDECYIMREIEEKDGEIIYEMIEDEKELLALMGVFEEVMDDIEIEKGF